MNAKDHAAWVEIKQKSSHTFAEKGDKLLKWL